MPNPFVRKLGSFARLEKAERQALAAAVKMGGVVDAGKIILREGQWSNGASVVLKGIACRYKILTSGERQILNFLLPGDLCDGHVLASHEMDHSIATISECVIAPIDHDSLSAIATGNDRVTRALWWVALVEKSIARDWIVNVGRRSAERRVAHLLAEIFVRLRAVGRAKANGFELPISQADLADATALSMVHVNRVLHKLRAKQVLTLGRRMISVTDARKLFAMADFNPAYLHLRPRGADGGA